MLDMFYTTVTRFNLATTETNDRWEEVEEQPERKQLERHPSPLRNASKLELGIFLVTERLEPMQVE